MQTQIFIYEVKIKLVKRDVLITKEKDQQQLVKDYAEEFFKSGFNCAESVLAALIKAGAVNMPPEMVAAATGFGGGLGLTGNTCGALAMAILANSVQYGRPDPTQIPVASRHTEVSAKHYRRYNNIVNEFIRQNGCATCKELTAAYADNWGSPERRDHCLKIIGTTVQLAYKYLQLSREEGYQLPYGKNLKNLK